MSNGRRQLRRRSASVGVGDPVVDPTENVLALVDVEKAHAKDLRETDLRHERELRDAQINRIKELAALRDRYDERISNILAVQVRATSDLISAQLDKVTSSLDAQIAALGVSSQERYNSILATLDPRITEVERFRYESGGKASVADPATNEALRETAIAIRQLTSAAHHSSGVNIGRSEIFAWLFGAIMAGAAIAEVLLHR
jgi:hypothetical protein